MAIRRRSETHGRLRAGVSRRHWIVRVVLAGTIAPTRAALSATHWLARDVPTARPLRQLSPGGPSGLLGVDGQGSLWALSPAGAAPRRLAVDIDPTTPLAAGHGRIVGRAADGGLWVLTGDREERGAPSLLAPHAGLLSLPLAVIGVAVGPDGQHVVRLEHDGRGAWSVVARSRDPVLPDARPILTDLDDRADGGQVLVLAGPDTQRYDHGVLGDAVEATRMLWLERHSLQPMRELALPAPYVFEDIAPRQVMLGREAGLLTVRSGPAGAQLLLVTVDPARADRLHVAGAGEALGMRHRWLAPTTDGVRLLAVHTPHIGGRLHEYRREGDRLIGRAVATDVSTHRIGTRDLDMAVWVGSKLLLPSQDGLTLRVLDPSNDYAEIHRTALPARMAQTLALPGKGVVARLEDGRVLSWPMT